MLVIHLVFIGFGVFLVANPDFFVDKSESPGLGSLNEELETQVAGVFYAGLGVILALAFIVALLTPRRFWAWIYNLVLICLGLTSCCFWPITIPLLIFWIKPEVRAWYRNEPLPQTPSH